MNVNAEGTPVLQGSYWLMPDGSHVPNIYGGSDADGDDADDGGGGTKDGDGTGDSADLTQERVLALNKELKATRAEAAKYRRQVREKEEAFAGVDVEKYNTLLEREQEAEQRKLEDKGKYDELLTEHQRRSEAQLTKAGETGDMWKTRYEAQVVDNVLFSSAASKAIDASDAVTLLKAHYEFNITDSGEVEILGRDGQVILTDSGKPATPQGIMAGFLESKPNLCKPTGGGSGSRGGGTPGSASPKPEQMFSSGADRIAAALRARMK